MVDISLDTPSTVQEAADKVTVCGIVRMSVQELEQIVVFVVPKVREAPGSAHI